MSLFKSSSTDYEIKKLIEPEKVPDHLKGCSIAIHCRGTMSFIPVEKMDDIPIDLWDKAMAGMKKILEEKEITYTISYDIDKESVSVTFPKNIYVSLSNEVK